MKKRKKGAGESMRKIFTVIKKANEHEKMKSQEKKKSKKKLPKGYVSRKLGIYAFWTLFVIGFLFVFVNASASNNNEVAPEDKLYAENEAVAVEMVDFGESFLKKYFNLQGVDETKKGTIEEKRSESLKPFVTSNILQQVAKIYTIGWDISLQDKNITLNKFQQINKDTYLLTYEVLLNFKQNEAYKQSEKNSIVPKTYDSKKYVTLKVKYLEELEQYIIYELPNFDYVNKSSVQVSAVNEVEGLSKVINTETQKEISEFLNTFFDAYTKDSNEKLAYLLTGDQPINSLNNSMTFVEFKKFEVYEGADEKEFVAFVDVLMEEPVSKVQFLTSYTLIISKKEGSYLVKSLNDKQYLEVLQKKIIVETEEAKEQ